MKLGQGNNSNDSFDMIPKGRYPVVIDAVEKKQAKTGTEYYEVQFTVIGEKYAKRKVWRNFFITEKAAWAIEELLNAVDSTIVTENDELTDSLFKSIIGNEVTGYIDSETNSDSGKEFQTIGKFKPANAGSNKKATLKTRQPATVSDETDVWG